MDIARFCRRLIAAIIVEHRCIRLAHTRLESTLELLYAQPPLVECECLGARSNELDPQGLGVALIVELTATRVQDEGYDHRGGQDPHIRLRRPYMESGFEGSSVRGGEHAEESGADFHLTPNQHREVKGDVCGRLGPFFPPH